MGELIHREAAAAPLNFSGERLTAAITGQVEIEHYHRYLLAREFCRGRDVLDVASGEGYGTALLAQVARTAVGVEIDHATVAAASAEFRRANLRYLQGDARALSLPDASIDVAVSFETLEHLAEQDAFLSELRRVLRPGGLLIISTPDRDAYSPVGTPPNPYHVLELTRAEFESLLQRHFAQVSFTAQRALIGSVILGQAQDVAARSYERRGDSIIEASDHLSRAPYIIAVASDGPLPPLPNSVYIYRSDLDTDPKERFDAETGRRAAEARLSELKPLLAESLEREAKAQQVVARETLAHQQTRQRLHQIEMSTTWRLSGPLRSLGNRFPFLARGVRRAVKLVWWTATLQLPRRLRMRKQALLAQQKIQRWPTVPPLPARPQLAQDIHVPSSHVPDVSVIISTYGQCSMTLTCLHSIAVYAPRCAIEVIVVDDAYPGAEDMSALGDVQGVQFIRNETNLGFLRSCNKAALAAKGRYILMLNNDTELQPGAIDVLVDLLDARPDAGMAGSKLLFPDGRLQEAGGILWNDASGWNFGRDDDPTRPEYNYVREVDYCSGASLLIRRALFEQLSGFDEYFAPAYYEDTDLAYRVRAAGLKVLFAPRSVVIHHEGVSHGTDVNSGVKARQTVNQARMLERWRDTLAQESFANGEHFLRARDRARSRKVMLVIDHYVPEPDRDAGSRSMMGIINSLLDEGWVVKFWPHNRTYSKTYTVALEDQGIEVIDQRHPCNLSDWMRENGGELDHILVSRPDVAKDVLPHLLGNTKAVLSYYGVDLHFARMKRQADVNGDARLLQDAEAMEQLERRVWTHFDLVLYPSEEEAAMVRAMAPDKLVRGIVPFCFDVASARPAPPSVPSLLFVAGFAHAPNVDAAVFLMREIVPQLQREIGPVTVTLAGSNPSDSVRALAGANVAVTGYVTDEMLHRLYASSRVSVVPLRFGAGVKGKVVEALSCGLPLVTTSIGAQGIVGLADVVPVQDDVAGIVAALRRLLTDDAAWVAQSAAQVAFAERCFSRAAMRRSVLSAMEAAEAVTGRGDGARQLEELSDHQFR